MPYSRELRKEDRILADRHPRVLDEGRPDEPWTHAGDASLLYPLSRGIFAAREPQTGDLFSTREPGEILPKFEDEPDGGEPADPRETPGDRKGSVVAFLPAELA